jgi:hypothetical protein
MEPIQLFDRAEIKGARRDGAGNLVVTDARIARAGIYDYAGYELGKPDQRVIRVLRPPSEVFSRDTMRSLAAIPVTDNHPSALVDTSNWKEFSKGETSDDDIIRDGECVKVPFIVRDEATIRNVEDGKHELSPGYTAVIDWTAGTDDQYGAYDAVARTIRYNHLAIVDRARGGSSCRIGDEKPGEKVVTTKTIFVDELPVEVTDGAEAVINKLIKQRGDLETKIADTETKLGEANTAKSKLEGEKGALEKQLADATDPAALQEAATKRAKLIEDAKKLAPKLVTDGKSDADIRKEVVQAQLGDTAKDYDDTAIAASFATLAAVAKQSPKGADKLRDAITDTSVNDSDLDELVKARDKAREAMHNRFQTASKPTADKE